MAIAPESDVGIPEVLTSCQAVMAAARHVAIDAAAVDAFARRLAADGIEVADDELLLRGTRAAGANFVLVSDALNFCFWSDAPWEVTYRGQSWTRTFAMVAGLLRAIERDPAWLTAQRWAEASEADVAEIFAGAGAIPLPQRRREILNETGEILRISYGGQFVNLVDAVEGDALLLARRLALEFPSFRDVAYHPVGHVAFLKRAQICAADLHRTWIAQGHAGLHNLAALTVFADYRLPQLFRHEGMLTLDGELAATIDREEAILAASPQEVELRAATVVIGEMLVAALASAGRPVAAYELDYELWRRAKLPEVQVPHHRTLTHFY